MPLKSRRRKTKKQNLATTSKIIAAFCIAIFIIAMKPTTVLATQTQNSLRTVWQDPFTQTTFHSDDKVNSTFYTFPQVIWNGSQYVDYLYNASDMSAGIGSVFIKVYPNYTVFYDPYQTEKRIQSETWNVECYNVSTFEWKTDNPTDNNVSSSVNSSGIYFDRTTTLTSGATLDELYWLRMGSELKISLILHPAAAAEYKLIWLLNGISGTKATWLTTTLNITGQVINDPSCSSIQFANDNESKSFVDWSDALIFNETSNEYATCFQQLELQKDVSDERCQANVAFGDFNLTNGELLALDPTIVTINSTATSDGFIEKEGASYPPNDYTYVYANAATMTVGQNYQHYVIPYYYMMYRTYLSFDTSSIPSMAYNISASLLLKEYYLSSNNGFPAIFTVQVWGGNQPVYNGNLTILQGTQPIYNDVLNTNSWGTGMAQIATWNTSNFQSGAYADLTIPSNQINKLNSTEFELNSSGEGTPPQGNEFVEFYGDGSNSTSPPELQVSYNLDTITIGNSDQVRWFYRNASSTKAVIVLFGGFLFGPTVIIRSVDCPLGSIPEKEFGKPQFLDALAYNGLSVYTPSNDSDNTNAYYSYYQNTSTWVQDLANYLVDNQTYKQVYLFGYSAGAIVVGNEIQKSYASIFSAAVMNCAPVDVYGDTYQVFHTAPTASTANVPTFFPEDAGDWAYSQTLEYYQNEMVQKQWLNWTGSHGVFFQPNQTSTGSCGDNDSVAVINWFNSAHPVSGNGDTIQLTQYPASWLNWQCVQSNDGDSSYVCTGSSGTTGESDYDLYNASFLMVPSGATNVTVSVHAVVRSTSAAHKAQFQTTINVTSTGYSQGGYCVPDTTYQDFNCNFTVSASDCSSLQIGVYITPGSYTPRGQATNYYDGYCTEVYAVVTWS